MSNLIEGSFTFVVPNISALTESNCYSKIYSIGNIPWKIGVRATTVKNSQSLSVCIYCNSDNESPMWKVEGFHIVTVLSHKDGAANVVRTSNFTNHSKSNNLGWSSFMDWDDLMDPNGGYVKDDSIQVSATTIIQYVVGLPSFEYNFEKASMFSDIVLVVEGQKLHANKAHLSIMSPVLEAMLSPSTNYEMHDVKYSEFLVFLAAIHQIPSTINENNVEFLLKLANKFKAATVFYQCEQFLMSTDDFALKQKFLLADKYCLAMLHNSCTKLLKVPDIENLKIDEGYKDLTAESKDVLLEIALDILRKTKET